MKIKYEQLFPTASFLNCRIGFETDIPDDGNVDTELTRLKDLSTAFHMKEFPQFYKENKPIYLGEEPEKSVQVDKPTDKIQGTLDEIEKCLTLDELQGFWMVSKGNLITSNAWKAKEKQLKDAK